MSCESCNNNVSVYQNRDQRIQVTLSVAMDITGAKVWFSVKDEIGDMDVDAIIYKANAAAGGSDSQIEITDATNGVMVIYILPADTANVDPGDYLYDVVIETTAPRKYQIMKPSRFTIQSAVTKT